MKAQQHWAKEKAVVTYFSKQRCGQLFKPGSWSELPAEADASSFAFALTAPDPEVALAAVSQLLILTASFIECQLLCLARVTTSPSNPRSLFCISREILSSLLSLPYIPSLFSKMGKAALGETAWQRYEQGQVALWRKNIAGVSFSKNSISFPFDWAKSSWKGQSGTPAHPPTQTKAAWLSNGLFKTLILIQTLTDFFF